MLTPPTDLQPAQLAAKFINLTSKHIFLTGKAGTGKTTFLKKIISDAHKRALVVAPTGIAAINAGGVTIHSLFQLPFGTFLPVAMPPAGITDEQHYHTPVTLVKHLNMRGNKRRLLLEMELLIIDEVSMLRADLLDAIDFVLRFIRKNNTQSFGGVQVLFIGDLHQLPPVVKKTEWNIMASLYKSVFFFDALALEKDPPVYIELEKIYRQADDVFINLLNNLRNNLITKTDLQLLQQYYKAGYQPKLNQGVITITTHNNKANTINKNNLAELQKKSFFYHAKTEGEFPENSYPAEAKLELKVGAQVMFIKNDPGVQRYFNGKIGVVTSLDSDTITVRTESPAQNLVIEQYVWKNIKYTSNKYTRQIEEEVIGTFTQFPLKLAWAITVHKSQGLTFDKAIIDLGDAFAPGQAYVAFSRLRSLDGLVLTSLFNNRSIRQDQNVHYFARKKTAQENLYVQIKRESDAFLKEQLLQAFNFKALDNYVYEHVFSYAQDNEDGFIKQTYLSWAVKLQQELMALKAHADKFLNQIQRLFANPDEVIGTIVARIAAAEDYFNKQMANFSHVIFELTETLKQQNKTKQYIAELFELEAMFYNQQTKMAKAKAYVIAFSQNQELSKADIDNLHQQANRTEQLSKAMGVAACQNLNNHFSAVNPKKKPEKDTKLISFNLFKEGKNIAEIAKERKIAPDTVKNHLAFFITRGELDAKQILDSTKLNKILKTINELKSINPSKLKAHLGKGFKHNEIKTGIAAYLAQS